MRAIQFPMKPLTLIEEERRLRRKYSQMKDPAVKTRINPILDGGGGKFAPPAGFLNIAQKPLGLGS